MSEGAASCWPLLRFSTPDPNMLLLQGAVSGDADLVKRALERGAFIDYRDKNYGGTALGLAALNGRLPVLDVLLQHRPGPAMGARDRVGDSALHWAALNGHPATVTLLLEHGADPTWRNSDGDLPVDMAGRGVGVTASSAEARGPPTRPHGRPCCLTSPWLPLWPLPCSYPSFSPFPLYHRRRSGRFCGERRRQTYTWPPPQPQLLWGLPRLSLWSCIVSLTRSTEAQLPLSTLGRTGALPLWQAGTRFCQKTCHQYCAAYWR